MSNPLANALTAVFGSSRRVLALIALACVGLLAFGMYLQHAVGLEPCPMCIVQRYALVLVGVLAAIGSAWGRRGWLGLWGFLAWVVSGFGAFVAARQSLMQWNPPEIMTCGRDFYGVIENFPLRDAIPMLFRGTGDCAEVEWSFLGLSIANWSFVAFAGFFLVLLVLGVRRLRA